jgi:hypothetical protein
MKRLALIKNGVVHDIVIAGDQYEPPEGMTAREHVSANIGDMHDGAGGFSPVQKQLSRDELYAYARRKRKMIIKTGLDFNLAAPGGDPHIVRIPTTDEYREAFAALASVGEPAIVALPDQNVSLTGAQIFEINRRIVGYVARSITVLASIIDGITANQISSTAHIDIPETATAVKLLPWFDHHA